MCAFCLTLALRWGRATISTQLFSVGHMAVVKRFFYFQKKKLGRIVRFSILNVISTADDLYVKPLTQKPGTGYTAPFMASFVALTLLIA